MTLYHVDGDVGSGKTLLLTHLSIHANPKIPIHANYHIDIPNFVYLKPEDLNELEITKEIPKRIVLLTEAYAWLESRLSGRPMNIYMGNILFQSRKIGIDMYLDDQIFETIDIRFRKMTNYEVHCEQRENGFHYIIDKISRFRRHKPKRLFIPMDFAKETFKKYNSWERIQSIDDDMIFKITKDKTKIMSDVDNIAAELIKKFPNTKKITKGIVSNHCIRNNIPKSYIDLIYNSVKETELYNE